MGQVVAIRRRKGHLLAMIHDWGRWYPVEYVIIERKFARPCSSESKVREVFADRPLLLSCVPVDSGWQTVTVR